MAYNEALAEKVRKVLGKSRGLSEMKMFGGIAFLMDGKMFCGVLKDDLMVRVDPARDQELAARPHARPMDFTGRPMNGFLFVGPGATKSAKSLERWIGLASSYVSALPAKKSKK